MPSFSKGLCPLMYSYVALCHVISYLSIIKCVMTYLQTSAQFSKRFMSPLMDPYVLLCRVMFFYILHMLIIFSFRTFAAERNPFQSARGCLHCSRSSGKNNEAKWICDVPSPYLSKIRACQIYIHLLRGK